MHFGFSKLGAQNQTLGLFTRPPWLYLRSGKGTCSLVEAHGDTRAFQPGRFCHLLAPLKFPRDHRIMESSRLKGTFKISDSNH